MSRLAAVENTFYEIRGLHGFRIEHFPPLATTTSFGHWFEVPMAGCHGYHQPDEAREPCHRSDGGAPRLQPVG